MHTYGAFGEPQITPNTNLEVQRSLADSNHESLVKAFLVQPGPFLVLVSETDHHDDGSFTPVA